MWILGSPRPGIRGSALSLDTPVVAFSVCFYWDLTLVSLSRTLAQYFWPSKEDEGVGLYRLPRGVRRVGLDSRRVRLRADEPQGASRSEVGGEAKG